LATKPSYIGAKLTAECGFLDNSSPEIETTALKLFSSQGPIVINYNVFQLMTAVNNI